MAALLPFSVNAYRLSVSESENGNRKPFSVNDYRLSISETEYRNRFQNTETETETPPKFFYVRETAK